jgi:membrane-bound inhibitor of C-type lysozyme
MKKINALVVAVIFVLAVVSGFFLGKYVERNLYPVTVSIPKVIATAKFYCDNDKTISAIFRERSVSLLLSDGRTMTLPQAISASGARYANAEESFVFWNKGDTAFIQEEEFYTFENCAIK